MFKVKVITQGKLKEKWMQEALHEYEKRLLGKMTIQWILIDKDRDFEEKILNEPQIIALDIVGKELSSEQLSHELYTNFGTKITFVIGGATGLSESILKHAKIKLSLSKLTFTHQMVRVILTEQLYRAIEIHEGSQYHK